MDEKVVLAVEAALAKKVEIFKVDEDHQFAAVPATGGGFRLQNLKEFLPPPDRVKQQVELLSVAALLAYITRYMTDDTVIFANETQAKYETVFDYHTASVSNGAGEPERRDGENIAVYACPKSDPWTIWTTASGKMMTQVEFATFIETNLREVVEPNPTDFLQLCLQLSVHKAAEFESELDLGNGQVRFRYQEDIRGSAGNKRAGDIDIPKNLGLQMPVFVDGAVFGVPARFKYRMDGGKLAMGYELIRPREIFEAAVKRVTTEILSGTEAPLFQGARR